MLVRKKLFRPPNSAPSLRLCQDLPTWWALLVVDAGPAYLKIWRCCVYGAVAPGLQRIHFAIQYVNSVCQFSMSVQYVSSVSLVLIITGENFGIPIPILAKYRIGKVLAQGDFVLVKRCYEKQV